MPVPPKWTSPVATRRPSPGGHDDPRSRSRDRPPEPRRARHRDAWPEPSQAHLSARPPDRGQAAVVVLVVAAVFAVLLSTALAEFGGRLLDRDLAQDAADAAALAALDPDRGGRSGAAELARRNGAVLVSFTRGPGPHEVTVVVRVGDSTATARASDAPP